MKLTTSREFLLRLLQSVIGVVERRQTMAILANVLVVAKDNVLSVTATDLEVELVAQASVDGIEVPGSVTVPGRKLLDIFRALNNEATVSLNLDEERLTIKSGRSRFVLSTLPAADFPVVENVEASNQLSLSEENLHQLLDKTHFCMAQQDVLLQGGQFFVRYALVGQHAEAGVNTVVCLAIKQCVSDDFP